MHLSDEQLLEIDDSGIQHLKTCTDCANRANNLNKIRTSLSQIETLEFSTKNWDNIYKEANNRKHQEESKHTNTNLKKWKFISLGLAASLIASIYWPQPNFVRPSPKDLNNQITQLIKQNNQLQIQLTNLSVKRRNHSVNYQLLTQEITSIDNKIQQAYLYNLTEQQKLDLWIKRKLIVKQMLSADKNIHQLSI